MVKHVDLVGMHRGPPVGSMDVEASVQETTWSSSEQVSVMGEFESC
jgi:hypothetical protein